MVWKNVISSYLLVPKQSFKLVHITYGGFAERSALTSEHLQNTQRQGHTQARSSPYPNRGIWHSVKKVHVSRIGIDQARSGPPAPSSFKAQLDRHPEISATKPRCSFFQRRANSCTYRTTQAEATKVLSAMNNQTYQADAPRSQRLPYFSIWEIGRRFWSHHPSGQK